MQLEPTSAVSNRQQILYEDARLAIEEEWQLAYREGRQPRTSAVLSRVLELNPELTRRTARLVCAIGLRRWLEENPDQS
jgi:hypothetical protein